MTSVITGDIINSRLVADSNMWIKPLEGILQSYGEKPKNWEIYRGDSFQVEIPNPEESLWAAIYIKAQIRSFKELDVRIAIGIGEKEFDAARITESNGSAFVNSGETFEGLKKQKKNLAIKSSWPDLDADLNMMIALASIAMDRWSVSQAEVIVSILKNSELSQKELAKKIGVKQPTLSKHQSRSYYNEIAELEKYYRKRILQQLQEQ